ncbi:MAG: PilZ domain-containing protein [Proteobacteria bacterium]|nr:PilZ domain-containing protein [Pseudomonadota bacterium]
MEDKRKIPRVLVHWHSAIVSEADGEPVTTQGMTYDISDDGVSVICHRSIPVDDVVTVYLLIHTGIEDHPELVIEAQGKVIYNVFSGEQGGFRLGIRFIKFAGASEKILLKYMPTNSGFGAPPHKTVPQPETTALPAKTAPAEDEAPATVRPG